MQNNLTETLAIYAAILSSILFIKELIVFGRNLRKDRRSVSVKCRMGVHTSRPTDPLVEIKAVNSGFRPVTISSAGFRLSDGRIVTQFGGSNMFAWPLPKTIGDSEDVSIFFDYQTLVDEVAKEGVSFHSAQVMDAEGNVFAVKLPKSFGKGESPFATLSDGF